MAAAIDLVNAGADVVVVEASHRPGGRVRTVDQNFQHGQYAESGAEWIDDHHERVRRWLERAGVRTLGVGEQWTVIRRWLHHQGRLLAPDQVHTIDDRLGAQLDAFDAVVDDAARGVLDPARPTSHDDAHSLDHRSLADVAVHAQLGELAALFRRRDAQGEFAAEPGDVSLLFVAQQRAYQRVASGGRDVRAHRVDGGLSRIARHMAHQLNDCLRLGEMLVAIDHDDDGVTVRTTKAALAADHVVLACSLVPLRSVRFTPELPPALHAAMMHLGYGSVTKTAVQWPTRGWPPGYATTDRLVQRVYEPTVDQQGEAGVLMAYCGGDGGHRWAAWPAEERLRRAADEMRAMFGLEGEPIGGFSRAWSTKPRYGGSYAVYRPGQVTAFWDVLRRPHGRLHLAGEHVATCTGYVEGALESGEAVAARLLAH
jgi:monoamine oxidase